MVPSFLSRFPPLLPFFPNPNRIIAELCERAGLPPGVLNIVHGTVPTVNAICDHPDIKAISFVGGDKAGKHIYDRYGFFFGVVDKWHTNKEVSAVLRTERGYKRT